MRVNIKETNRTQFKLFDIIETDDYDFFLLIPVGNKGCGAVRLENAPHLWSSDDGEQIFDSVDQLITELKHDYVSIALFNGVIELSN